VAVLTLAACGGGGSGGGANAPAATSPTMAVTSANYVPVANESAAAATDLIDLSGGVGSLVGAQTVATPNWTVLGLSKATEALSRFNFSQQPAVLVGAVLGQQTVACGTGTMTVTVNDANNNRVADQGDSADIVLSQCSDATSGTATNGRMVLTFNAPPPAAFGGTGNTLNVTLAFTPMVVSSVDFTATANGSVHLVSTRTSPGVGSDLIETSAFAMNVVVAGTTYARTLSNFSATVDVTATESTTRFSGIVTSSALNNGSVAVATVTPFVRATSAFFPASGSATATGTSGKTTLTAIDATQVRIDLDANNDGVVEASQTLLWSSII
jgi:hypothetical protein